eukprot:9229413-Pyramimonas_sp.AAC.1
MLLHIAVRLLCRDNFLLKQCLDPKLLTCPGETGAPGTSSRMSPSGPHKGPETGQEGPEGPIRDQSLTKM